MKTCPECGATNSDSATACGECGIMLVKPEKLASSKTSKTSKSVVSADVLKTLASKAEVLEGKRKADVMFVLDCTGSMRGEIDAIKDAIADFSDTIETDGVRVRVGLVEFRDRLIGEEHRVLLFGGQPFTNNPKEFRSQVSSLKATGGGDDPESSLDAVMLALRQPFAPDSNKVIVLVTDAPPHIPDKETKTIEEVNEAIRSIGIQQFYLVIRTEQSNSQVYLKLLTQVRGSAFELGKGDDFRSRAEDFKRTLMSLGKTISSATR